MTYIHLGKIVNTHGIKGELRIKSTFKYKEKAFIPNNIIYLGNNYEKHIITSYRKHKEYDMITLDDINNINDVLQYKNMNVYIKDTELKLNENEYLDSNLIDLEAIIGEYTGKIKAIKNISATYQCLVIEINHKEILYPYKKELIIKIDFIRKKIYLKYIEGLI